MSVESARTVARSRWNRLAGRRVIPGVGNKGSVGAALVAAAVVLSGCGAVEAEKATTTTTVASGGPVNPWTLPLEERPPLFDPCVELPIEAVHAALGPDAQPVDSVPDRQEGGLYSCGWENGEVLVLATSAWRSSTEFAYLQSYEILDPSYKVGDRVAIQLKNKVDVTDRSCYHAFLTEKGAVVVNLNLTDSLRMFRGQRFSGGCAALDQLIEPILPYIPEGDFL